MRMLSAPSSTATGPAPAIQPDHGLVDLPFLTGLVDVVLGASGRV